ncbi:hypothetical protein BEP19_04070 [Ammoniphilus oxalaticus]|uniref:Uncharacterized protein n=1 Tax=Ammoniphilus oxalaticus TaxID=66863 RepID=A0A419SM04_9BACL|nr:hypothetical protein [Ammoniphilus oxalaticus]RKD25012.1 hypothetical protein BEP19_04070 [Ammoniphilus oxalaticus]
MKRLRNLGFVMLVMYCVACSNQTGQTTVEKEIRPLKENQSGLVNSLLLQGEGEHWEVTYDLRDETLVDPKTIESNLHADLALTSKEMKIDQMEAIHFSLKMKDGSVEKGSIYPQQSGLQIKERDGQLNLKNLLTNDIPHPMSRIVSVTIEWDGQMETFDIVPPKSIEIKMDRRGD